MPVITKEIIAYEPDPEEDDMEDVEDRPCEQPTLPQFGNKLYHHRNSNASSSHLSTPEKSLGDSQKKPETPEIMQKQNFFARV